MKRVEDVEPPYSNTAVGDTGKDYQKAGFPQENQALIDWIEFTCFLEIDSDSMFNFLCLKGKPETAPKGLLGYRTRKQIGAVIVLSDGSAGMGVHVIIPPKAMQELGIDPMMVLQRIAYVNSANYRSGGGSRRLVEYFKSGYMGVISQGEKADIFNGCRACDETGKGERVKLTRLDLALDDIIADTSDGQTGKLHLKKLASALKRGNCVSKMHTYGIVENGSIKTGKTTGRTYYIGKRQSNSMLRAYDKRQEQIAANGGVVPDDLPDWWCRFELELKHQSAQNAAALLLSEEFNLAQLARGILNRLFSVRVRAKGDENKSRWKVAPWWSEYINTLDKIMIGRQIRKPDMDTRRRWFVKQAGPSFVMLLNAYGADHMESIYKGCRGRLTEKQKDEVSAIREKSLQNCRENASDFA